MIQNNIYIKEYRKLKNSKTKYYIFSYNNYIKHGKSTFFFIGHYIYRINKHKFHGFKLIKIFK
jgi:hypothetical protein